MVSTSMNCTKNRQYLIDKYTRSCYFHVHACLLSANHPFISRHTIWGIERAIK